MSDPIEEHGIDLQAVFNRLIDRTGMSKYAIAQQTGISQSLLSRYASGERRPTLETLCMIADLAGVKLDLVIKEGRKGKT